VPNKKDYFVISTFNEETENNTVCVHRKQKLLFRIGASFTESILDLKIFGTYLFMPRGQMNIERIEIKAL
jgi:hypothetical protein